MLKIITQFYKPSEGKILINGNVQALMELGIGFHPDLTGRENIYSALELNGKFGKNADNLVKDIAKFCELGQFLVNL